MNGEGERKALTRGLPARVDYEVGYGRPPKAIRFKPGVSGNPKGSKNRRPALHEERLKTIILDEAYRTIDVRDGERTVTVPMVQAIVRSLAVNAAKGRARVQELFTALLAEVERANRRLHDQWLETAIEYKVEREWELARRARLGIEGPEPLPHPDHIKIDMRQGQVVIKGPMTREEKAHWDWMHDRKAEFEAELAALRHELDDDPDHPHRDMIEADIAHTEKVLAIVGNFIGD